MSWIKLHRSLLDNPLWQDKPFARGQAWVDLLLLANGVDRQEMEKGRITHYERGTVCRSVSELAERWGWSRKKATTFLKLLATEGMLTLETSARGSKIILQNWRVYQNGDSRENRGTTENTAKSRAASGFVAGEGTTEEQQRNNSNAGNTLEIHKNGTTENATEPRVVSGLTDNQGTTEEQQRNNSGTAEWQKRNTIKNVKKDKKEKEQPTNQLTTSMLVGCADASAVVGCCGNGNALTVPSDEAKTPAVPPVERAAVLSAGMNGAVPSALGEENQAGDCYRYRAAFEVLEKSEGIPLSPRRMEQVMELVDEYGTGWVQEALQVACRTAGCRSRVAYAQGVLRNWKLYGKDPAEMSDEERLAAIVQAMRKARGDDGA